MATSSTAASKCWKGRNTSLLNASLSATRRSTTSVTDTDIDCLANNTRSTSIDSLRLSSTTPSSSSFDLSKTKYDISILAKPLPHYITKDGGTPRERNDESNISILEEGREWYGYDDEGIRRAAVALGVVGPWVRVGGEEGKGDGDGDGGGDRDKEGKKDAKAFWHSNGRKLEGYIIPDDDSESEESERGDARGGKEGCRKRRVRWKKVLMMFTCGILG